VSATTHGAACGVVLGIVLVIFLQQVAYLDLSDLVPALEYLIVGALVGGVIGGLLGMALGHSYLARHQVDAATKSK